jgi:hypothetical protein
MAMIILNNKSSTVPKIKRSKDLIRERKLLKYLLIASIILNILQLLF